jgi:gliding motility-associated-like protein
LNVGANTITVTVIAQDGTIKTYSITVTREGSINDYLSSLKMSRGALAPAFAGPQTSYSASVVNGVTSLTITPTAADTGATIKVNTNPVKSGTASPGITLAVGSNTIDVTVTASDGTSVRMYAITVTRAAGSVDAFGPGVSVTDPVKTPEMANDGILVHQGISPNGDGINDFLMIEGIQAYPANKLMIMDRSGQLVYEASGYNNSSKVFDGHSSKNGQMQLPGTYFYQLNYTVKGITKTKTGFIVLKY